MRVPTASDSDSPGDRDLPGYFAVLAIDTRGFSENSSAVQTELNTVIVGVLAAAFARAGLSDAWRDRRFPSHTGDGYLVGLRPRVLPRLVDPFLRELQDELYDRNRRRLHADPPLRLRASLHVGPLPDRGRPNDGVGKPMTDVNRLLDSAPVRQALEDSDEEVTLLAAIVSARVYEDVVLGGYTPDLPQSQFEEVEVAVKGFRERAYLHVPRPSRARRPAAPPPRTTDDDEASADGPPPGRSGIFVKGDFHNRGNAAGRDVNLGPGTGR
jgi:class 3 adenylate cyclase